MVPFAQTRNVRFCCERFNRMRGCSGRRTDPFPPEARSRTRFHEQQAASAGGAR